jgi:hypothetical protein
MSELKPFNSERIYWAVEQVEREAGDIDDLHLDDNLFYLKSEADKVIVDLEESHKMEVKQLLMEIVGLKKACKSKNDWCLHTLKIERYQKYKRCLAMVKYCHESTMWLEECGITRYATFMLKWEKRWMKLAEKFKEGV